jgi:hypothetical protein
LMFAATDGSAMLLSLGVLRDTGKVSVLSRVAPYSDTEMEVDAKTIRGKNDRAVRYSSAAASESR